MDLGLRDASVIITAASAGIGLEAARSFVAEGANVTITGRSRERLDAAVADLAAAGPGTVHGVVGDMADPAVPADLVSEVIARNGRVDVLVNNVGRAVQASFAEVTDAEWDELWNLNVMSYVRMIREAVPGMVERGSGVIVNVSSTAGKRPSPGMPHYSVTKAAVQSLSRLVADTYAGSGIRSMAICPGPARTPAWLDEGGLADQVAERKGISAGDALAATGAGRPIGRMAEPEEIAAAIVFAASPRSSYATGAAWSVDGGSVPSIV